MSDQSQYDFIMSGPTGPRQKKNLIPGSGSDTKTRLIFVGGVVLFLVIFVPIIISLMFSGGGEDKKRLLSIAQQQAELVRIAEIGEKKARNRTARNLAVTVKLSMLTDQTTVTTALKSQGVKVGNKELQAGKNEKTDEELTVAEQTNRFDEAFLEYMHTNLASYQEKVKAAYDIATSKSLKETLNDQYNKAGLLDSGTTPDPSETAPPPAT